MAAVSSNWIVILLSSDEIFSFKEPFSVRFVPSGGVDGDDVPCPIQFRR